MNRSALGLILVILGSAFLLANLGWIPNISRYIFSWPNILLLIGLGLLISGKPKPALIFILIGGFFFAQRYFHLDTSLLWPVVLIVLGIAFILRKSGSSSSTSKDNRIDETTIFSGSEKTLSSPVFEGGKLTTIFGGSELDFKNTTPAEGAVIDVFIMFGGSEMKIPANWNVILETTPVFGGVSDERDKSVTKDGPTIRIKGFVLFGGIEIKA